MIKQLTAFLLAATLFVGPWAFGDINARNGVSITTASTINGVTPVSAVNGLTVVAGGGPTLIKSEDFSSAASGTNALSDITGWTQKTGSMVTTDGYIGKQVYATTTGAHSLYYWSPGATALDQSVEVTYGSQNSNGYLGAAVRVQSGADSAYWAVSNGTGLVLEKRIAGTVTALVNNTSEGAMDKVRISVAGSGSATRLSVEKDTGSGWVAVSGMSNIDPSDYLGAGAGGIAAYSQEILTRVTLFVWYND